VPPGKNQVPAATPQRKRPEGVRTGAAAGDFIFAGTVQLFKRWLEIT